MKALRKLFENPPKGGNEVGVPTASSMAPLPGGSVGPSAQRSLKATHAAGVAMANSNKPWARDVGEAEFRNYDRGRMEGPASEEVRPSAYDYEHCGNTGRVGEVPPAPAPSGEQPSPQLRPDTSMPYRTDGKPNYTMGVKPSGNSPTFRSDGDDDEDDTDSAGGMEGDDR